MPARRQITIGSGGDDVEHCRDKATNRNQPEVAEAEHELVGVRAQGHPTPVPPKTHVQFLSDCRWLARPDDETSEKPSEVLLKPLQND
jgi:hypothetical protein